MFSDDVKAQLKDIFSKINKKVLILYFSEGNEEPITITKAMLEEIREIDRKSVV